MSAISPIFAALFRRLLVCLFGAALMFCASLSAAADEDFVCPDYVMESFRNEGLASLDRMDASRMSAYTEFVGKCARAANKDGRTILHDAIYFRNTGGFGKDVAVNEVVQFLIKSGADVNAKGSPAPWDPPEVFSFLGLAPTLGGGDWTPMHDAAWVNDLESAKLLLKNGADINVGGMLRFDLNDGRIWAINHNQTPLMVAIFGENLNMVKLLVDNNADTQAIFVQKTFDHPEGVEKTPIELVYSKMEEERGECVRLDGGGVYEEMLVALGVPECAQVEDLSQKIAESIDVLNAAGAALAMAGNAAGFKRAHPLIDYNQNGGSFGFAWTVSDEYMLVGLDDTIGLTWSGDRWTVKSQLIGGDKLSSSLSAGWEITF